VAGARRVGGELGESLDAFVIAALNGPDEAFRYAKGEPSRSSLNSAEENRLSRPLDFAAVTEHAEWLGEYGLVVDPAYTPEDPEARERVERYRASRVAGDDGRAGHVNDMVEVVISGMVRPDPTRLDIGAPEKEVLDAARTIWRRIVEIAESHNDPGRFTTLNGFEWTPTPGGVNRHRVIIFRGNDVPDLPLSNYEASHPEQLWDWLETAAGGPDNVLAITHNANFSNGEMFNPRYSDGREIDEVYARRRALWEPLSEMFQSKGSSETTPALSPHDAFAGFEIVATQAFQQLSGASGGAGGQMRWATLRGALQEGLRQQERVGVNPFQIGFVSGNDGHSGTAGNSEAKDWTGGNAYLDDTPDLRLYGEIEGGIPSVLLNPGGLTGVWATENTRDALFDGLRRRETFSTSGVRLVPRLFGGWDLGAADVGDLADAGYRKGVPMGAELPARPADAAAPTFLVHAAKDALGANLDRIQIVKCWTTRGQLFEEVFDVAASDGRTPDPRTGVLPPVGNTVDASQATYRNDIGATELSAAWTDPAFDASLACAYYARILEIPTPRWSTYDAVKHGKQLPTNAPATVQQRAWTSPVWYTPTERDRADRPAVEGMFTVAELADRGIRPMTDQEIRAVTVGRTVRAVNLVTGFQATIHYGADGNRSLMASATVRSSRPMRSATTGASRPACSGTGCRWRCSRSTDAPSGPETTRPATSTSRRSRWTEGRDHLDVLVPDAGVSLVAPPAHPDTGAILIPCTCICHRGVRMAAHLTVEQRQLARRLKARGLSFRGDWTGGGA
jgi:hypothetical protein